MTRGWRAPVTACAVGALLLLPPGTAVAAHARGQEILPVQDYVSADARALAEAHVADLAAMLVDVTRCEADLDVHLHGIGFRRPRGVPGARPHLVIWVWLDQARPPGGADFSGRAGDAFARHGRRLFRRLLTRTAVETDPRLGGYGVVITWFPPGRADGAPVGESLIVFADRDATTRFVRDAQPAGQFLGRADLRFFDGQTEARLSRPVVDELPPAATPDGC